MGYRISYWRGVITILSPSKNHERIAEIISGLVRTFCRRYNLAYFPMDSTTLKKPPLAGKEPDHSFALETDKALPDLAIEVTYTSGETHSLQSKTGLLPKAAFLRRACFQRKLCPAPQDAGTRSFPSRAKPEAFTPTVPCTRGGLLASARRSSRFTTICFAPPSSPPAGRGHECVRVVALQQSGARKQCAQCRCSATVRCFAPPPPRTRCAACNAHQDGSIADLEKYKYLGIKEVWLWKDREVTFYCLDNGEYEVVSTSICLPQLRADFLITFINRGLTETPLTIEADFYRQLG